MTLLTLISGHCNKAPTDAIRLHKILRLEAVILVLATMSPAHATTTSFAGIHQQQLDGISLNGWTFNGDWEVPGYDGHYMPVMNDERSSQSISYNAGLFTFKSMTLGGRPSDDFHSGRAYRARSFTLHFSFLDSRGNTLLADSITLANSNAFSTYINSVAGVHEILFRATAGGIGPNGQWADGFWPRLASITVSSDVPEPTAMRLLTAGLIALMALRTGKRT
nr:hypothetical protein [Herbaspirillum sp. ASV7]